MTDNGEKETLERFLFDNPELDSIEGDVDVLIRGDGSVVVEYRNP
jgi:hypothetical protein